ncbi:MAG: MFS transporter [Clostridia bacterium]|nr:MFS transporter [Clostridia bacterium]
MKEIVREKKTIDYRWVIVALSFLMVMICLGFCSSPKSLFIAPVTEALGIDRGLFSINDSLRYIATAVINVFFGTLIGRFGAKKLISAGFLCLILSQLLYSFATNVIVFYLGGIFLGLGLSWTTTTMVGAIVNKWCKENKGTIMGAVLAANGIGGAIAIQVVTPIIASGGFGYRNAYRLIALILLVVCAIILIFFKNSPSKDDTPMTKAAKKSRSRDWPGIPYARAIKMPYFYCALICIFMTGLILQSVNGVAAAHMRDCGLDPSYVGTVLSIHSLVLAGFKFLVGFIYDKCGLRTTVNICMFTSLIVMILLVLITDSFVGKVFAMIYGIFSSLALPLETIMLPIYAGDLFGQSSFNKILGIFVSFNTAGYAVGAPMINFIFDKFGSYNPGFILCAILMLGVIIAVQILISAAHRYQREAEEAAAR